MTRAPLRPLALALAATFALAACDATLDPAATPDAADLTAAEVTEATEIVAEALAEDAGGLVASARDLTASVTESGLAEGSRVVRFGTGDVGRPCRSGFSRTYDPATGTHHVGYRCGAENAVVQKGYAVRLAYQFRDAEAGFVARPWQDWDAVDSVAFRGHRQGFVKKLRGDSLRSESTFEQDARWALSGLSGDAAPAVLAGRQTRTGSRVRRGAGGLASRAFTVELASREILIRESADGLTHAVSGEVAYTLTLEVVRGGRTQTRTVEGTVELDGDGRGLLRVLGLRNVYRVSLADGETDREA